MFERVISQTIQRIANDVLRERSLIPLTDILDDERVPARLKPFFATEVQWWLYNESLARATSRRFDYEQPELNSLLNYLEQVQFKYARFEREEFLAVLDSAVKLTYNYLCRPQTTLKWYIFRGQPVRPLQEVMLRFDALSDYEYFRNVFIDWIESKQNERATFDAISAQEFERIIRRTDDQILLNCTVEDLLSIMSPLFEFIGEGEAQRVPVDALVIFFDDKNIKRLVDHLERYRDRGHEYTTREEFVAVLDELLSVADDEPEADFSQVYQNDELDDVVRRHLESGGQPGDLSAEDPLADPEGAPWPSDAPMATVAEHPPLHEPPAGNDPAGIAETSSREHVPSPAAWASPDGSDFLADHPAEPVHEPIDEPMSLPDAPAAKPSSAEAAPVVEAAPADPMPADAVHAGAAPVESGEDIIARSASEHGADEARVPSASPGPVEPDRAPIEPVGPPTIDAPAIRAERRRVEGNGSHASDRFGSDVAASSEGSSIGRVPANEPESPERIWHEETGGDIPHHGSPVVPAMMSDAAAIESAPEAPRADESRREKESAGRSFAALTPTEMARPFVTTPAQPQFGDVRRYIDASLERKVIKKIFNKSKTEYDQAIQKLNAAENWRAASQILDELFIRFDVDPYSRTAVRFTDSVYGRYLSRGE